MKYIEELLHGDCFGLSGDYFILTSDFKSNGYRLCVSLKTGSSRWIKPEEVVDSIDIFTIDKENAIIAIKERKKDVPS
jgi:hypothetical protein